MARSQMTIEELIFEYMGAWAGALSTSIALGMLYEHVIKEFTDSIVCSGICEAASVIGGSSALVGGAAVGVYGGYRYYLWDSGKRDKPESIVEFYSNIVPSKWSSQP